MWGFVFIFSYTLVSGNVNTIFILIFYLHLLSVIANLDYS